LKNWKGDLSYLNSFIDDTEDLISVYSEKEEDISYNDNASINLKTNLSLDFNSSKLSLFQSPSILTKSFGFRSSKTLTRQASNFSTLSNYSESSKDLRNILKNTESTKNRYLASNKESIKVEQVDTIKPIIRKQVVIKDEQLITYNYRTSLMK
jgi:hypothetical protein